MSADPNAYNATQIADGAFEMAHVSEFTRRVQRQARLSIDGMCGPRTRAVLDGFSPIAKRSREPWDGRPRPLKWRGAVHGLVVHTTGRTIVNRAIKLGKDPGQFAIDYYQRTTGTHYVIDYDGTIWQVASEHERAYGVGTKEQENAENSREGWQKIAGPIVAQAWIDTWGNTRTPLGLIPDHPNACMVHCELPPLPAERRNEALASGLWYTAAQHEAVAHLAIDIAQRNGFAHVRAWWLPKAGERILEHGDITPVSRMDPNGVYDLGGRRLSPRFQWPFVYTAISEQDNRAEL